MDNTYYKIISMTPLGDEKFLNAAFLRIESRSAAPVVSLALFKMRTFSVSVAALVLNFAGQSAVTFLAHFDDYARRHAVVIQRYGRFPHRNAVLGRNSTPEELDYLSQPGAGF